MSALCCDLTDLIGCNWMSMFLLLPHKLRLKQGPVEVTARGITMAQAAKSQNCSLAAASSVWGMCRRVKLKERASQANHKSPKWLYFKGRIPQELIACHPFLARIFIWAIYIDSASRCSKRRAGCACVSMKKTTCADVFLPLPAFSSFNEAIVLILCCRNALLKANVLHLLYKNELKILKLKILNT